MSLPSPGHLLVLRLREVHLGARVSRMRFGRQLLALPAPASPTSLSRLPPCPQPSGAGLLPWAASPPQPLGEIPAPAPPACLPSLQDPRVPPCPQSDCGGLFCREKAPPQAGAWPCPPPPDPVPLDTVWRAAPSTGSCRRRLLLFLFLLPPGSAQPPPAGAEGPGGRVPAPDGAPRRGDDARPPPPRCLRPRGEQWDEPRGCCRHRHRLRSSESRLRSAGCPARGTARAGSSTCENCSPAGNMRSQYVTAPTVTVLLFLLWIQSSTGCNKALCASDVSKCLIQELCQCRPGEGNCSCCKECMLCLGTLWDECCDCVGMCNPRNYSDTPPTSKSTVEELHEPIPSLFRALTEGDTQLNWNIVSFPVAEELSHHENLVSFLETVNQPQHQNVSVPNNNVHTPYSSDKEHMCTVVYFDDCMSIHQCKISCESMGASKYRWFHNACCECIGPECIDYGSKTVKCMNCMF